MSQTLIRICHLLGNISLVFEGDLGRDNPEVIEMRNEVLYKPIEGISKDRENLKNDVRKVSDDMKKAYSEYKKDHNLVSY